MTKGRPRSIRHTASCQILAFFFLTFIPKDLFAMHTITGPWWAQVWLSQMNLEYICNLLEVYVWISKAWWCAGQLSLNQPLSPSLSFSINTSMQFLALFVYAVTLRKKLGKEPTLSIFIKCFSVLEKLMTPIFIAVLFMIAMIWKQPICPSIDECIKKMC